jgi:hypothetical protein
MQPRSGPDRQLAAATRQLVHSAVDGLADGVLALQDQSGPLRFGQSAGLLVVAEPSVDGDSGRGDAVPLLGHDPVEAVVAVQALHQHRPSDRGVLEGPAPGVTLKQASGCVRS